MPIFVFLLFSLVFLLKVETRATELYEEVKADRIIACKGTRMICESGMVFQHSTHKILLKSAVRSPLPFL